MLHTAKFYTILSPEDINLLSVRYQQAISLTDYEINKYYNEHGIMVTIRKLKFSGWYMFLVIDFIRLLDKSCIDESDKGLIEEKLSSFTKDVFGTKNRELILIRIDYRVDTLIKDEQVRKLLFHIYKKSIEKYRFQTKYDEYDTTIYFNSRSIQCIAYDKSRQRLDKNETPQFYERDMVRYEVRLNNQHLNYRKNKYGIEKLLSNYLWESEFKKYMNEQLTIFFFKGDYYKIYRAQKIIDNSDFNDAEKHFIRNFLVDVSKHGVSGVRNLIIGGGKHKYSDYKFKKAIRLLEHLSINPILIPKNLTGPSYIKNPIPYDNFF